MPTLYSQVDSNVRKTWGWITAFALLLIGVGWYFSYYLDRPGILVFAVVLSFIQVWVSYYYSDKIVLSMAGARPIEFKDNQEIYRLVENLCITAGLPTPKIYLITDPQPNAFATGRDEQHAVIALTTGLIEILTKSELEGVISHELSHIKNRDTFLQAAMVVLVGILTLIADIFWRTSVRRSDNREERGGAIIAILGLALIFISPILGKLMQMAISRKREFLADASGAMITRNPEGLASALEKIAVFPHNMRRASDATAHLFIVNPLRGKDAADFMSRIFSTHPSVAERIAALRESNIQ
ncbi:MAG: M48 family metallopeptidase [Candidatus Paceibacterota bacterium]